MLGRRENTSGEKLAVSSVVKTAWQSGPEGEALDGAFGQRYIIEWPAREETLSAGQVRGIEGNSVRSTEGVQTPAAIKICEHGIVMSVESSTAQSAPVSGFVIVRVVVVDRCRWTPRAMHPPMRKLQKRRGSIWAVESGREMTSTCGRVAVDSQGGNSVGSTAIAGSTGVIVPDRGAAASALLAFCRSHDSNLGAGSVVGPMPSQRPSNDLRVIRLSPTLPAYPHFSAPPCFSASFRCRSNESMPRSARDDENQSLARKPPARADAEGKIEGEDSMM